MKIVFEGFDGSGKSTAVKELSNQSSLETFWSSGPPGSLANVLTCCEQQLTMDNVIMDRVTCISEACYNIEITSTRLNILDRYRNEMGKGSVFVYCIGQGEESSDGLRSTSHDKLVKENRIEIKRRYEEIMSKLVCIRYDFNKHSFDWLASKIGRAMSENFNFNLIGKDVK